jgi:hypothetical protein
MFPQVKRPALVRRSPDQVGLCRSQDPLEKLHEQDLSQSCAGQAGTPRAVLAVSAIVELREARPFALDGELQSPARVLAVQVVPRALNVLVEGGET